MSQIKAELWDLYESQKENTLGEEDVSDIISFLFRKDKEEV